MPKFETYTIPSKTLSEADDLAAIAHEIAVTLADKITFSMGGVWLLLPQAAGDVAAAFHNTKGRRDDFLPDDELPEIGEAFLESLSIMSRDGAGVCVTTPYGSFALFTVGQTKRFGGFVYGDGTHLIGNAIILSLVLEELAQLTTTKDVATSNPLNLLKPTN